MQSFKNLFFSLFLCIAFQGCTFKDSSFTPTEADQYFLKIVREEFGYDPILKHAGKTLYIYLPRQRDIFTIQANKELPAEKKKFSINELQGNFRTRIFNFQYDIAAAGEDKDNSKGLANAYSNAFSEEYRNVFTAVSRAYMSAKIAPVFIVIIFADIKNGVEVVNTLSCEDLKKYGASYLSSEEYSLRVLSDSRGDQKIIGDLKGDHLDYAEITWPDFLSKQIVKRVKFKYMESDFDPDEDIARGIFTTAKETLKSYQFTDFSSIHLHDIRSNRDKTFSWLQVFEIAP